MQSIQAMAVATMMARRVRPMAGWCGPGPPCHRLATGCQWRRQRTDENRRRRHRSYLRLGGRWCDLDAVAGHAGLDGLGVVSGWDEARRRGLRRLHLHVEGFGCDLDADRNPADVAAVRRQRMARTSSPRPTKLHVHVEGFGCDLDAGRNPAVVAGGGVVSGWQEPRRRGLGRLHVHVEGFGCDLDADGNLADMAGSGVVSGRDKARRRGPRRHHLHLRRLRGALDTDRRLVGLAGLDVSGVVSGRDEACRRGRPRFCLHVEGFGCDLDAGQFAELVRRLAGRGVFSGWQEPRRYGQWWLHLHVERFRRDLDAGGSSQWWQAAASSADGKNLVAVVNDGYIYTSKDSGATWTQTGTSQDWMSVASSADGRSSSQLALAISTRRTIRVRPGRRPAPCRTGTQWRLRRWQNLVAAVSGGYIYTSKDSGATWTQAGTSQAGAQWRLQRMARTWSPRSTAATSTRRRIWSDLETDGHLTDVAGRGVVSGRR